MDREIPKLSVYVVEDSDIVLRRLIALIESSGLAKVVGTSGEAAGALAEILALMPDVVVADLHLRVGSGLDVISQMNARGLVATKIVLTNHSSSAVRSAAAVAGADHFYDKTSEFSMAIAVIETLAQRRRNGSSVDGRSVG